jgi:GntR family transcriptional regulator, transcriptional repressor for pyruvate dehydrogenase complex
MAALRPVSRVKLSEGVAAQIGEQISSGQWKAGQKLPSEAELSRTLQVSRSTVREALKSLAFVGLVNMRAGQGTYVAGGPGKFFERMFTTGLMSSEKDVRDLTEARTALETELVALCAERASDEELGNLERIVNSMGALVQQGGEEFLQLDLEFHMAIATCSQSKVLADLLRTIRGLLQEFIGVSAQLPGDRNLTYEQHVKIFEALKERNQRKARSAMRNHLQTFQRGYRILRKASESAAEAEKLSPFREVGN